MSKKLFAIHYNYRYGEFIFYIREPYTREPIGSNYLIPWCFWYNNITLEQLLIDNGAHNVSLYSDAIFVDSYDQACVKQIIKVTEQYFFKKGIVKSNKMAKDLGLDGEFNLDE